MEHCALITGGTNGIGREFAYQLAQKGYNIIIVGRDKKRGNEIVKSIEDKFNVKCQLLLSDLGTEKGIEKVRKYIHDSSNIDFFVNGAGFFEANDFLENDLEKWNNMIDLNSKALINLSYYICKKMKSEGITGTIINISSIAAFLPVGNPMYAGTKSLVRTFSLSLNRELKKYGIYIQTLCPGCVETDLWKSSFGKSPRLGKLPVEKVVKISLNYAKHKKEQCIPGFINKLIVLGMQILPRKIVYKISKGIVRY